MSRLLLVSIFVSLSFTALFAQGTKGRSGSSPAPQTAVSPATSTSRSTKTTITPSATPSRDQSSTPVVTPNRGATPSTTLGNSTSNPRAQERAVRPSDQKAKRPATYAPPTSVTAAKGGNIGTAQKATPLKSTARGTVNWMSLEQALEKSKTEKRKIFVDLYTDWCGWCKHMDSTTFVSVPVAKYLNEHYYPVKFNAEQEKDIVFHDQTYKFKKSGSRGYHELAALWLNNKFSFPTVVFLDENQQLIQPVPGYQDAVKMEAIINYFGSDSHKKTPWESYEKKFSNK